jgi:hypothetical protein
MVIREEKVKKILMFVKYFKMLQKAEAKDRLLHQFQEAKEVDRRIIVDLRRELEENEGRVRGSRVEDCGFISKIY